MTKGVYKVIESNRFYRLHLVTSVKKINDDEDLWRVREVSGIQFLTFEEGRTDVYWSPLERGNHGDLAALESNEYDKPTKVSYHDTIRAVFGVEI